MLEEVIKIKYKLEDCIQMMRASISLHFIIGLCYIIMLLIGYTMFFKIEKNWAPWIGFLMECLMCYLILKFKKKIFDFEFYIGDYYKKRINEDDLKKLDIFMKWCNNNEFYYLASCLTNHKFEEDFVKKIKILNIFWESLLEFETEIKTKEKIKDLALDVE